MFLGTRAHYIAVLHLVPSTPLGLAVHHCLVGAGHYVLLTASALVHINTAFTLFVMEDERMSYIMFNAKRTNLPPLSKNKDVLTYFLTLFEGIYGGGFWGS
eukprot:5385096-Amphidinium_carterae.1